MSPHQIKDIDYQERIVAFVDILGFSNLIGRIEEDSKLHDRLHWALTHIRSIKESSQNEHSVQSNLKVSVFSDCIVVTGPTDDYHSVIWTIGWLQANLLGAGILVRGGISFGKVCHSEGLLYGKGMLEAYHIENSAAVYPRVVIDPKLENQLPARYKEIFLVVDSDGLLFIDPFAFNGSVGNVDAQVEDGWDPHEIYLDEVEDQINRNKSTAKKVDHLSKWTWLAAKHAKAKQEYKRTGETKLTLLMKSWPNK